MSVGPPPPQPTRRAWLGFAAFALVALLLWSLSAPDGEHDGAPAEGTARRDVQDATPAVPLASPARAQPSALELPRDTAAAPAQPAPPAAPAAASPLAGDVVQGRVVSRADERALADAQVELLTAGDRMETWLAGGQRVHVTRSSADGRFRLEGLAAGRYRVRASAPPLAPRTSAPFELPGTGATLDLDLALEEPGQLVGRVVDEDGAAVSEVHVSLCPEPVEEGELPLRELIVETEVDERGVFVLDDLAPGVYLVGAVRIDPDLRRALDAGLPGYMVPRPISPDREPPEPVRAVVPAGDAGEVLVVLPTVREQQPCRLRGVITGLLPRDVLAYEVVIDYPTLPDREQGDRAETSLGWIQTETATVDAEGRFAFDALPARARASLRVLARPEAGTAAGSLAGTTVALPAGGDEWVELALPAHGAVQVRVLDSASGAELGGCCLNWYVDGFMRGGHNLSDQPLTLVLPAGRYSLRPEVSTHERVHVDVEIAAGRAAQPLELRLARARPWRPRLVGPGGSALSPRPAGLALTSWKGEALGMGGVRVDIETRNGELHVIADRLHEGTFDVWAFDAEGSHTFEGTLDLRRSSDTAILTPR